jgi:hypothetical protein
VRISDRPESVTTQIAVKGRHGQVGQPLGKDLQGGGLSQLQVVDAEHVAHAAPAERRHDAIVPGEHLPRREAGGERDGRDCGGDGRCSRHSGPVIAPRGLLSRRGAVVAGGFS